MSILIFIVKRALFSAFLIIIGVAILRYTSYLVRWFGFQQFTEQYFPGGTTTLWKLIGVACVIAGLLALGGTFSFIGF